MRQHPHTFFSEGHRLDASLFLPDTSDRPEKLPLVIALSGYQGLLTYYPTLFARYLTQRGYACFGFDYRGFALSEGKRGRIILDEQKDDALNAACFAQQLPEIDPDRMGIMGWGMAASHALRAANEYPALKAACALNGFFHGKSWLESRLSESEMANLQDHISRDRHARVKKGMSELVDAFLYYPLDPETDSDVRDHLRKFPAFGRPVEMQFFESVLKLDTLRETGLLSSSPVFVAHGRRNQLHPLAQSTSLFEQISGEKSFHLIEGAHNDFMHEGHQELDTLMEKVIGFFDKSLAGCRTSGPS